MPNIKLTEILHTIVDEQQNGLINLDDWKFESLGHLKDMGFDFDGDYVMSLKSPEIKVYMKQDPRQNNEQSAKGIPTGWFVIEDKDKGTRQFRTFEEVIKYFDTYSQPEFDKERA